jgi:hypothetical protein
MALIWTKLAAHKERLQRLNAQGALVTPLQKPKSRLETHAPKCARCRTLMTVRILIPCHARGEPDSASSAAGWRRPLGVRRSLVVGRTARAKVEAERLCGLI